MIKCKQRATIYSHRDTKQEGKCNKLEMWLRQNVHINYQTSTTLRSNLSFSFASRTCCCKQFKMHTNCHPFRKNWHKNTAAGQSVHRRHVQLALQSNPMTWVSSHTKLKNLVVVSSTVAKTHPRWKKNKKNYQWTTWYVKNNNQKPTIII